MTKDTLICKVYFFDTECNSITKIIGIVDRQQLFSPLNRFIEIRNYGNKTIAKNDIEKIIVYQKKNELVIAKSTLEVNTPLKIEG